jgi:rfaE bifunctional protein nucleotidyltransferase chain/domain
MFSLSGPTQQYLSAFRSQHQKKVLVFTNGCFDILHAGHVQYLREARALGDGLFVGLNSDRSIKQLKGNHRPIISQEERKYVLENLKCVDVVEIFDEETPLDLIMSVRPDILVKGGDWKEENIVGASFVKSYGGQVRPLTFKEGRSTTGIIEKIQKQIMASPLK